MVLNSFLRRFGSFLVVFGLLTISGRTGLLAEDPPAKSDDSKSAEKACDPKPIATKKALNPHGAPASGLRRRKKRKSRPKTP